MTFSWLVAGLVVVSLPCFTFWFRRRKRRRSVGRAITMLDGLEMLSSSSYQD